MVNKSAEFPNEVALPQPYTHCSNLSPVPGRINCLNSIGPDSVGAGFKLGQEGLSLPWGLLGF
jgi:hypothetical protein